MKLTSKKLKQIIKEEMKKLQEMGHWESQGAPPYFDEETGEEHWGERDEYEAPDFLPPRSPKRARVPDPDLEAEMERDSMEDWEIDAEIARLQALKTGM